MSKKHAKIEQLDGNVENSESDEESDNYDIAKDPNYEHRTYLTKSLLYSLDFKRYSKMEESDPTFQTWIFSRIIKTFITFKLNLFSVRK